MNRTAALGCAVAVVAVDRRSERARRGVRGTPLPVFERRPVQIDRDVPVRPGRQGRVSEEPPGIRAVPDDEVAVGRDLRVGVNVVGVCPDRSVRAGDETVGTTLHAHLDGATPDGGTHDEHSNETHDHFGTSTTSTTPSPTVTPTSTPSPVGTASTPVPDGTSAPTTAAATGGDGAGFGPAMVLVALAALTVGVLARRDC